jgi:hypothetical protein
MEDGMDLQIAMIPNMKGSTDSQNTGLTIEHAIMHYLDSEQNSLLLVDNEIELNIPTKEFLCGLINISLDKADAYAMDITGTSTTLLACRDMLATCSAFVPRSRELAEALYDVMRRNKNISSGDLLAIAAHDSNGPLLAIFKTDLNHEYERKYETRPDGTFQVILIPNDNVVPSERRPPQKCAFIRQTRTDFDVLLADNQIGLKEAVAKFFYRDFLRCELLTTPAARTLNFCRAVERWRRDHEQYLPLQGIVSFTKALHEQLQSSPLYFKAFAESSLLGSQNTELSSATLADTLAAKVFPDISHPPRPESFESDPDIAKKLIGTIHLSLMGDIQISGPSEILLGMIEKITDQNGLLDFHLTTPWVKRDFQKPRS